MQVTSLKSNVGAVGVFNASPPFALQIKSFLKIVNFDTLDCFGMRPVRLVLPSR